MNNADMIEDHCSSEGGCKIQLIDSIMGSGKTTWAINYMNAHPNEHFIYVTPRLKEVSRIVRDCAQIGMHEPKPKGRNTKSDDLKRMIYENKNIATTHEMLSRLAVDDEFKEHLQLNNYHMILDEVIEVVNPVPNLNEGDVKHALRCLVAVDQSTGKVTWSAENEPDIGRYMDLKKMADAGTLFYVLNKIFMWMLPISLLKAVPKLTIMSFMFEGSHLANYLTLNHLQWETFYVDEGILYPGKQDLKKSKLFFLERLHIYSGKLNDIGRGRFTLSSSWWGHHTYQGKQAFKNAYNFFRNIRQVKGSEAAWSAFKKHNAPLKGFQKSFVEFNSRSTNDYKHKNTVAYLVNVFENPDIANWFASEQGGQIKLDQDAYALSTLLQWLWRFSIRERRDLFLYLPSERMRGLLTNWLKR